MRGYQQKRAEIERRQARREKQFIRDHPIESAFSEWAESVAVTVSDEVRAMAQYQPAGKIPRWTR